jgi:type IV secretory pathway component VirB8
MKHRLSELAQENNEDAKEYFEFIKSSTRDGSYFKDALDWYLFRYVSPICDRTILLFGAIVAAVVLYFLIQLVEGAFPLLVEEPIFIRSYDQTKYFPNLVALKPKKGKEGYDPEVQTVDEAYAKYLLSHYVTSREGYDFSKAEIEDVNKKFNHMRNLSSASEYRNFQAIMSKDNPNSPIRNFGMNVNKTIQIDSVKFYRKEAKDLATKARLYLSNDIPTRADIRFTATIKTFDANNENVSTQKERYLAKINFTFDGVNKDVKNGPVNFAVNTYTLYKVK